MQLTPRIFQSFLCLILFLSGASLSAGSFPSRSISPETPVSSVFKKIEEHLDSPRNKYLHAFLSELESKLKSELKSEKRHRDELITYLSGAIEYIDRELKEKPETNEPEQPMPKYSFARFQIQKALEEIEKTEDLKRINSILLTLNMRLVTHLELHEKL